MVDRSRNLIIAGGGIGGLTAALALSRAGIETRVLERSATPQIAGAGIQITPNAGRVLAELGLEPAIDRLASTPEAMDIRSWRGQRIITVPFGKRFARRYRAPYRTIHRADLLGVLLDASRAAQRIDLLPGHAVVEFALHPAGLTVMAEHDGHHEEYLTDGLVGADGIGSFVRSVVPKSGKRSETGRTAWRAVVTEEQAPPSIAKNRIGLWLGPNGHVVHYPVRGGAEFNIVVVGPSETKKAKVTFADLRQHLRRWASPVQQLLELEADWQAWPIGTVRPSGQWGADRVVLLGDAAHAMAPFLAQGGAMAIEDAAVLTHFVSRAGDDIVGAFKRYSSARKPRVRRVWRAANSAADLYHMGAATGAMRNFAMRLLGGSGLSWRYRWVYGWRPPKTEGTPPKSDAPSVKSSAS